MTKPAAMNSDVINLLEEAAEFRLLGLLFEYPSEIWREQLTALLPDLREERLRTLAEQALQSASGGLHIALFGPAGSVPVREVTYRGGVQFGYLMAELAAYYDAFGYRASTEEASDHMAVELGFVAYLRVKQALALVAGATEQAGTTADAAAAFLKEHVALMAERVAQALDSFAPDYLASAGRIVFEHAGPSPSGGYCPVTALPADDDSEVACGAPLGADC